MDLCEDTIGQANRHIRELLALVAPDGAVPASDDIVEQESIGIDQFDGSDGAGAGMIDGGSGDDDRGGMRDSGSRMMGGINRGWRMLIPAGLLTTVLGLAGGAIYWGSRRQDRESDRDDAIATLETEYARGAIDEEELQRRFDRLKGDE